LKTIRSAPQRPDGAAASPSARSEQVHRPAPSGAPAVHAGKIELRVLGTCVTLQEHIRKQAEQDLGMRIRFIVDDGSNAQRVGVMHPDAYEIYDQWFHSIDCLWPARAIQPIDVTRIHHWDEINSLPRTGRLARHACASAGSVPVDRLYVQRDGTLGRKPSKRISMLPLTHNADSFVYLVDALPASLAGKPESWSWLLAPELAGRVALQADAAIGAIDAALAVQASGAARFADIGNLTVEEIDTLIEILIGYKKRGHFAGFWSSSAEAAQLMISNKVAIQSIWSPTTVELEKAGLRFRLASPREGYRAWFGGVSLSRVAHGRVLDAAYEYLNWWLSGWPGATVARQGFYMSNPERSRLYLTEAEWDYWYDGKPAANELPGPTRKHLVCAGQVRDGGSYVERMGRVAVWNSVMDEHNYLVRRWSEFMKA
jgi:putative spermidine/putrescine transport system substrate-binding protein